MSHLRGALSGTPVQNNLNELWVLPLHRPDGLNGGHRWALFDFLFSGKLLGTAKSFKMEYANCIERGECLTDAQQRWREIRWVLTGNARDSSSDEQQLGAETARRLCAAARAVQ